MHTYPTVIARITVTALLIGWLTATAVGGVFAALQYNEVTRAFPPEQVATEYQTRIDREMWRGSLLIYVQMGVLAGALWWQIGATGQRAANPIWAGTLSGMVVGTVQLAAGLLLRMPILLLVLYVVVLIATGIGAGLYYRRQSPDPDLSR